MTRSKKFPEPLVSIAIPTYNRAKNVTRLIDSVMSSKYKNIEIIVSDDGSTDGTIDSLTARYKSKIRIIKSRSNLGVAHARNMAIKASSGKYIFLIDDDNVLDQNCISALVKVMEINPDVNMCGPVMYFLEDPEIIWWAGTKRNMYTSKTYFPYINQLPSQDHWETDDFPNAWMFRADGISGHIFDDKLYMHYEESDFAYRIREDEPEKKFIVVKQGIIFHDIRRNDPEAKKRRWLQEKRVYYTARNRLVFHKRYSSTPQLVFFMLIFNPLFTLYYLLTIFQMELGGKKHNLISMKAYIKGVGAGYAFTEKH